MNLIPSRPRSIKVDDQMLQDNACFSLQHAATHLGLRYDRKKKEIDCPEWILEGISSNFADYVWSPEDNMSRKYEHCASTTEEAKTQNKLKLPLKATCRDMSLGTTYNTQKNVFSHAD